MQNQLRTPCHVADVDVALPLQRALPVDVDLPLTGDAPSEPQPQPPARAGRFQPSMSQVAADVSELNARGPNQSRPGYHGSSAWNWMRDGRAGFGERSIGAR